jgi:hypothetical protein
MSSLTECLILVYGSDVLSDDDRIHCIFQTAAAYSFPISEDQDGAYFPNWSDPEIRKVSRSESSFECWLPVNPFVSGSKLLYADCQHGTAQQRSSACKGMCAACRVCCLITEYQKSGPRPVVRQRGGLTAANATPRPVEIATAKWKGRSLVRNVGNAECDGSKSYGVRVASPLVCRAHAAHA